MPWPWRSPCCSPGLPAGHAAAGKFLAGWITEYSLSLDNLFVFVLLISRSPVPSQFRDRVLLLGITLAVLLRGAFIALGAVALALSSWVLYLFAALLIATAVRMGLGHSSGAAAAGDNRVLRTARRVLPVAAVDGAELITRSCWRWRATPMLLLACAIGTTDLMFALDSIPAIFGLTRAPYLVFTASVFALLGLRHLYLLADGLLRRLAHLSAGLAVILAFIGVKLLVKRSGNQASSDGGRPRPPYQYRHLPGCHRCGPRCGHRDQPPSPLQAAGAGPTRAAAGRPAPQAGGSHPPASPLQRAERGHLSPATW